MVGYIKRVFVIIMFKRLQKNNVFGPFDVLEPPSIRLIITGKIYRLTKVHFKWSCCGLITPWRNRWILINFTIFFLHSLGLVTAPVNRNHFSLPLNQNVKANLQEIQFWFWLKQISYCSLLWSCNMRWKGLFFLRVLPLTTHYILVHFSLRELFWYT